MLRNTKLFFCTCQTFWFLFCSSIFTGIHSITDTSFLAKYLYWMPFVTLIKTFLHFITFFKQLYTLNNYPFVPNCSRGWFSKFWAKFPIIFPRKHFITASPPPPIHLAMKQYWTLKQLWNNCVETIIFLGIYWTSFVAFIIRITFIGTFLNLLRSWNTLKNTITKQKMFFQQIYSFSWWV